MVHLQMPSLCDGTPFNLEGRTRSGTDEIKTDAPALTPSLLEVSVRDTYRIAGVLLAIKTYSKINGCSRLGMLTQTVNHSIQTHTSHSYHSSARATILKTPYRC